MAGRVVIPIHDENGFLVAYAGRSVDQTDPKYRFPPRFRKSLVLSNLHRAAAEGKSVIVVEGFFDCLNVYEAGLPGSGSDGLFPIPPAGGTAVRTLPGCHSVP